MRPAIHTAIHYIAAGVWLINGLLCKVLNLVPRHREIVSQIIGQHYAGTFTFIIGLLECLMALWILSGLWARANVIIQVAVIITMNLIEFSLAPHLLLWGRFNIIWALLFSVILLWNEFGLNPKKTTTCVIS